MKISLDWISEFVDLADVAPDEIAEQLTVHTAEVDGWEAIERVSRGVVAGQILSAEPVSPEPEAPVYARVDTGGETINTVCGAPNATVGARVAVALPGIRLAGGDTVQVAEVYGKSSEAVLCSPAELGWSDAHDALLLLPPDVALGTDLETLVPHRDVLLEIDNKSLTHRPDLWGHYGVARELAAIFDRPLKPYAAADLAAWDSLPAVSVEVESAEDCPFYSAIRIDVGPNRPSPLALQSRLHAIGSRSRNLLVDVTNYVQFELGQPSHAFDAGKVQSIRVAAAGSARSFTTLDGKSWQMLPEDLLIYDGNRPIAIAGVMGGLDSEVSEQTRTLLLESANFRASRVRLTSVRLGLRTDASLRFEKKLPPVFARMASGRILALFAEAGYEHQPVSRFSSAGDVRDRPRTIRLPAGYLSRRAGAEISDEKATGILESIGFGCTRSSADESDTQELVVTVPPFRSEQDISIPEDISEEVMRLYGYDRIPPRLPAAGIDSVPDNFQVRNYHRSRRVLAQGHGFVEVHTYGWFVEGWLDTIGYRPTGQTLDLRNPLGADRRRMRDTLLPNLLAVARQNRKAAAGFRIFELGKVFWMDTDGEKQETNELAGVAVDQDGGANPQVAFRSVRGAIEDMATAAGLPRPEFRRGASDGPPWNAGPARLDIYRGEQCVGAMGLLPTPLRKKVIDAGHAIWFRLRIDELAGPVYPTIDYRSPPVFPGSYQDFTFVWPLKSGYQDLHAILAEFRHDALQNVEFLDVYTPKGKDTANYTFRFHIRWADRTISSDEIQHCRDALLAYFEQRGLALI